MNRQGIAQQAIAAGISALVLAAPLQAGAAIYIKFDGVKGESSAVPGVEPDEIDARATARAAGDEHEVEYDIVAAPAARSGGAHEAAHVVQQRGGAPQAANGDHKDWIIIESMSSPLFRDAASGLPTGKRQHKPMAVTRPVMGESAQRAAPPQDVVLQLPATRGPGNVTLKRGQMACVAGTHFPSAHLRDDAGNAATLTDVTVESCPAEQISLNYTKIEW